jgi:hypothetical protein
LIFAATIAAQFASYDRRVDYIPDEIAAASAAEELATELAREKRG